MLWTVLSPLCIIMHKRERRWQKRRNDRGEMTVNFSRSSWLYLQLLWLQAWATTNTGIKHRALRELYRHSTTWTTSPGQKFINNSRRRKFRAALRLARECTCFLILKIHGKLLVAEKWGFGNIKLYLKLIVMNSWTIFKGLCKWFPYSSQTSCELGKVTAQTMW